ncbi:MAG: hypothetical protein DI537_05465 [Stutzerimonas stutzeri]|nr:MAG: hypothetical protein DI537_05465 [Stutzerimonas stutzeri]
MTSEFAPIVGSRSKLTPPWLVRIDESAWAPEVGWVREGLAQLPVADVPRHPVQIAMLQRNGHWIAVAAADDVRFRFDLLSFVALWNGCNLSRTDSPRVKVELFVDLQDPYVLRHPSIIPMEVAFDHHSNHFTRSMIYSVIPSDGKRS